MRFTHTHIKQATHSLYTPQSALLMQSNTNEIPNNLCAYFKMLAQKSSWICLSSSRCSLSLSIKTSFFVFHWVLCFAWLNRRRILSRVGAYTNTLTSCINKLSVSIYFIRTPKVRGCECVCVCVCLRSQAEWIVRTIKLGIRIVNIEAASLYAWECSEIHWREAHLFVLLRTSKQVRVVGWVYLDGRDFWLF